MGLLNSFFWLVYGLALLDMVIFIPNFCGFVLSIAQVGLCLIFSKKGEDEQITEQLVDDDGSSPYDESNSNEAVVDDRSLELL